MATPAAQSNVYEAADDFVITDTIRISSARFTGLLPSSASLGTIQEVEVEIYHVFPNDSAVPPSGNVPARANSPADVEIDSATRDSLDGSLSYTASLISLGFTAANSVVDGIHKFWLTDKTAHPSSHKLEQVLDFLAENRGWLTRKAVSSRVTLYGVNKDRIHEIRNFLGDSSN